MSRPFRLVGSNTLKISYQLTQNTQNPWLSWSTHLDRPQAYQPCTRPMPRPCVSLRPRYLPLTEIETWMRDPYSIYARYILQLCRLDPLVLNQEKKKKQKRLGKILHRILESFCKRYHPYALSFESQETLLHLAYQELQEFLTEGLIPPFWWPYIQSILQKFFELEQKNNPTNQILATEITRKMRLSTSQGDFVLVARVDRIDQLKDGALKLIDYKIGTVPSPKEIQSWTVTTTQPPWMDGTRRIF